MRAMTKKFAYTFDAGKRLVQVLNEKDIDRRAICRATGISHSTLYCFLYDGTDISSARLAAICKYVGVSMDYIMGLKK